MKHHSTPDRRPFALLTLLAILLWTSGFQRLAAQSGQLLVGAASASITPKTACYLAGYDGAGLSVGVHDSLYAKVVVVSGGGNSVAILTLDCIGLMHPELQAIRRRVGQLLPGGEFDPANLVVSSTHTHLGPDVVGLWGRDRFHSGVQRPYMEELVETAAVKVAEAWRKRRPATARYGLGSHGEGWVFNISIPEEIDRSVTVLQFLDTKGNSIATLTNFACHPTILGPERKLISADYVGGLYLDLDQHYGGVNLFLQGAIGGWVQPVGEDSFENAEQKGRGLGLVVRSALGSPALLKGTDVSFRSRIFKMPVKSFGFKLLSRLGVLKRKIRRHVRTEIAWFEIGEAQFVTHPGESSPWYGLESKRLMKKTGPKFVLGLAMDAMGYLLKPEFFDKSRNIPHADYLTKVSVGVKGGPAMMKVIEELSVEAEKE